MNSDNVHLGDPFEADTSEPGADDSRARPRFGVPGTGVDVDVSSIFYWNLPEKERARLLAADLVLEDEGYLAHDINWGRSMLDVSPAYIAVPEVSPDWVVPSTPERFSDAIAAILHVAVEADLDAEAVCAAALSTHGAVRRQTAAAIRRE